MCDEMKSKEEEEDPTNLTHHYAVSSAKDGSCKRPRSQGSSGNLADLQPNYCDKETNSNCDRCTKGLGHGSEKHRTKSRDGEENIENP